MFANLFQRKPGLNGLFGQPETYEGMGGAGPQMPMQQGGGILGMGGNPNYALMMAGAGILGGKGNSDAMSRGMQGAATGQLMNERAGDRRENLEGQKALQSYIGSQQGMDPNMAALLQANPQLAQSYVASSLTPEKPTDDMREYNMAKQQGFTGSLLDYQTAVRRSSATNVNVNSGEKGYDNTVGSGYGKVYLDGQAEARAAQKSLTSLSAMEKLMEDPALYSGSGSENVMRLKRMGAAMGLNPEGIDSMEAFSALSKQAALDSMGGSLGTGFSNADRDFVTGQVPGIENTPQGNKTIIGIQKQIQGRKIEVAKLAREYAKKNGGRIDEGFDDYLAQWAEQNPLFPQQPSAGGGADRAALEAEARRRGLIK